MIYILLGAVALPFLYQKLGEWRDRLRYPPPGKILNGFHFWSKGETGPTVVLECGISSTCLSWIAVQDQVSTFARACSYDRAGLGWSGLSSKPRCLDNLVSELRAMLKQSGVPKPYILVAHSFGALIARHFAALQPDEVRGILLVDPLPTTDWSPLTPPQAVRLARGVKLSRRGAWLAQAGIVRLALDLLMSGSRAIPQIMAKATAGNGASVTSRLVGEVRKLPREVWPMVRAHWCVPKSFRAMGDYLEALPANAASAKLSARLPMIVLTRPDANYEVPEGAIHRVATQSGHWIQLDQPDLVTAAIRELLDISR